MGAEGFEPTTYAGYLIYSQAPNQFEHYSHYCTRSWNRTNLVNYLYYALTLLSNPSIKECLLHITIINPLIAFGATSTTIRAFN